MRLIFRQVLLLLVLALAPALLSGALQMEWNTEPPPGPGEVLADTVRQWPSNLVLWVDARPRAEFEAKHIRGAVPMQGPDWDPGVPAFFAAWTAENTVVVYGGDAVAVAGRLRSELKIEPVYVLRGGMGAWRH